MPLKNYTKECSLMRYEDRYGALETVYRLSLKSFRVLNEYMGYTHISIKLDTLQFSIWKRLMELRRECGSSNRSI